MEQMARINNEVGEDEKADSGKVKEFLYQFITKEEEASPDFPEAAKKMIAPQWTKFNAMLKKEMGIK